ncbi:hypothetical protein Q4598_17815 [Phaeobacter inhibens]|nr:hypothetical protein [Phaeobacter inhibens]MDO6758100.1 hypothetical protein [Phaeobacter inhibens]
MEFCTDSIFGTRHHVYVCSGLRATRAKVNPTGIKSELAGEG